MLRSIIVDDETPSRKALCNYLNGYCPDVEIVSECDSFKTAHKAILDFRPELVFLDIEMPNGNGFDLLKEFNPIPFKVIFVTAYSHYALQAFKFSASDYLLKPVKVDELIESINKVRKEIIAGTENLSLLQLLHNINLNGKPFDKLVIPDMKGFQVLNITDIICCEADGYCTRFHLESNEEITSTKNLKYYEDLLSEHQFVRVHHSWLINPYHVKRYTHQGDIIMTNHKVCDLGNNYKKRFLEFFAKFR